MLQRDEEAAHERDSRRPRHIVLGVALEIAVEIEIEVRLLDGGGFLLRFLGDAEERQARGKHEGLLRAGDDDVDAPFVGLHGERADGGDAVGDEDGVGVPRERGDALQVGDGAGGGFGVHQHDGVIVLVLEGVGDLLDGDGGAVVGLEDGGVPLVAFADLDPAFGELAVAERNSTLPPAGMVLIMAISAAAVPEPEMVRTGFLVW